MAVKAALLRVTGHDARIRHDLRGRYSASLHRSALVSRGHVKDLFHHHDVFLHTQVTLHDPVPVGTRRAMSRLRRTQRSMRRVTPVSGLGSS